jgi:hypothetical protein
MRRPFIGLLVFLFVAVVCMFLAVSATISSAAEPQNVLSIFLTYEQQTGLWSN